MRSIGRSEGSKSNKQSKINAALSLSHRNTVIIVVVHLNMLFPIKVNTGFYILSSPINNLIHSLFNIYPYAFEAPQQLMCFGRLLKVKHLRSGSTKMHRPVPAATAACTLCGKDFHRK